MSNKLMIVESPSKCAKIGGYLKQIDPSSKWDVEASFGHIQDLNKDKKGKFGSLAVNKETLELDYQLSKKGSDVIKALRKKIASNNYDRIVIATDPDREGEAIAEHLRIRLQLQDPDYDRCTFNEITKDAIKKALENPRKVNQDLIKAQDTRRILDRVVGWEATSAVSRAINQKTPIGRVINQAVKFVVEREEERRNFVEQEHYSVKASFDDSTWVANLDIKQSNLLGEQEDYWKDKELAQKIVDAVKGSDLKVIDSKREEKQRFAPYAFKTSTMQKAAINKLKFKGKKCDEIAQKLYQNGHITYIRTDSTVLSEDGFKALKKYADEKGLPVLEKSREGKKGKVAQEAHECIRPTDFSYEGDDLPADEKALYQLIRDRTIASQLKPALYDTVSLVLKTEDDYVFKATGSTMTYKGWKEYLEKDDSETEPEEDDGSASNPVPLLEVDSTATANDADLVIKKTKIPPRLTQATLIDMLESKGIGRPSTYSSIYEKIGMSQHGYVSEKKSYLEPSEHAEKMVEVTRNELCIMDTTFTMNMEDHLDDIANGKVENDKYVFEFFETLDENLQSILKRHSIPDEKCLACGEQTLRKIPRKKQGFFWACQNEDCKKTFSDENGKPVDFEGKFYNKDGSPKFPCPNCNKALIQIPSKKNGKLWWICTDKGEDGGKKCGFITANTDDNKPDFEYQKKRAEWEQKVKDAHNPDGTPIYPCPDCGKALIKNEAKSGSYYFKCSARKADCDFFTMADDEGNPQPKRK